MNKFVLAFGGVLVGSFLIIGSAQADVDAGTPALTKCQECVGHACYDEANACMSAPGCLEVELCARSCKDDNCVKSCFSKNMPLEAATKAVNLFHCVNEHAKTDCSNVCS